MLKVDVGEAAGAPVGAASATFGHVAEAGILVVDLQKVELGNYD